MDDKKLPISDSLLAVKAFLFPTSYQRLVSKCPQQPSRRRYDVSRWKTDRSYLGSLLHIRPDLLPQQQWEGLHPCEQQSRNHDKSDEIIKQWGFPAYTGGVFTLKAGDVITMTTASFPTSVTKVWMGKFHSFMGAFLIWARVVIFGRRLNALFDFIPAEVKHWLVQRLPLELDASFLSNGRHLGLGFIMSWLKS